VPVPIWAPDAEAVGGERVADAVPAGAD
jgi:hypothetical protein